MHQQAVVPIKICIGILKCNEKISFKKLFIGVILLGHSLNRKWSYCSLVFINKIFDLPHFWAILVGSYIDLKEPVGFFFSAKRKKKTNASMDSSRNHTSWREHSGGRMPAVWAGDVSIIRSPEMLLTVPAPRCWCWGFPPNSKVPNVQYFCRT